MEMKGSVLLTDGSQKNTLAAVRTLGKKGLEVGVIDISPLAQSFYSRYCSNRFLLNPYFDNPQRYVSGIRRILSKERYDVLLPIGWHANYAIAKYQMLLEKQCNLAIASIDSIEIAANKDKTMQYAERIGVNIPKTFYPRDEYEINEIARECKFPLVIKGSIGAGSVRYPQNREELVKDFQELRHTRPIVQDYVKGTGFGFFGLYDHGSCQAFFMHQRLREYPTSGGPSTMARSVYSHELEKQGKLLLDALQWHGVAMVEYKRDIRTGKFVLMEINPKFWGSLELAIKSGVDFPYLAYLLAKEEKIEPVKKYATNVIFRWPFPADLLGSRESRKISRFILEFMKPEICDDIWFSDIVPNSMQLINSIKRILRRKNR
jgi:predicted ATP-grasp superfamily ATP-dependent carboligase